MKKMYKSVVGHGWLSDIVVAEFSSLKAAEAFIKKQLDADDWWLEKVPA